MTTKGFATVILAAGQGTRMKSPLPKVLHPVAGVPMIQRVIHAVRSAGAEEVRAVVGYGEALVRRVLEPMGIACHTQAQQRGTADAVASADPASLKLPILICNGDHPLLEASEIKRFWEEFRASSASCAVLTAELKDPGSFGRIVRQNGQLRAIVEVSEASADTLKICEVNTGIYFVHPDVLTRYLPRIQNRNKKNEFYLTDLIGLMIESPLKDLDRVIAIKATSPQVAFGVNTQKELAQATKITFRRKIESLMNEGVLVIDPRSTYVEDEVTVGAGSVLYPGVYLRGRTRIGKCCVIEPNCYIAHGILADAIHVYGHSYIENASIESEASIGPFARLRPGTEVGREAHIGNFVELKKTKFGARSKAGHLSYLGDATIGEDVNIGCGTITCNYAVDKQKYRTIIGDRSFVGSDSQFVAPVEIGADSVIGSGSTITKDVPAKALAVTRAKQVIKENWKPKGASSNSDSSSDSSNTDK